MIDKMLHLETTKKRPQVQPRAIAPPPLDSSLDPVREDDAEPYRQQKESGALRVVAAEAPDLAPLPLSEVLFPTDGTQKAANAGRHVMMLGLRGVPDIQGGVERHVEMLAQELIRGGWRVEVIGRSPYLRSQTDAIWKGILVTPLWAPRSMMLEAFVHTFAGVVYAAFKRPDILHIHAIGPGLFTPLARVFGLKVVTTHHGYDYDREKWGPLAKRVLRLGERLAVQTSNAAIAVSRDVKASMRRRYARDLAHVPNGVAVRPATAMPDMLERFGLERRRYIVMVARIVPEKRQMDLIAAFARLPQAGWKLAIVGDADHRSRYFNEVEAFANAVPGVVMTGFQSGEALAALYSQAGLFVLPSLHEGMPISLLEALSYGLPVLASDIPANHEVELPPEDYFLPGDIEALAAALRRKLAEPFEEPRALSRIRHVERNYTWSSIARTTADVYRSVLEARTGKRSR
nr:glycosyl transferase [Rhizobium sp. Q54]